jgi:ribosomal-protein-alanine N-acetyltransferase
MNIPTITTDHLNLRPFTEDDTGSLHKILSEKDVLCYFPNPESPPREKVSKLITDQLNHWAEHAYGWWAVEARLSNILTGWCGLQYLPHTEEVEISYLLCKSCWGNGYATEAALACIRYGFETMNLATIVAIVHPANSASRRVTEKLGMSFTYQAQYFDMDCCRYSIDHSTFDLVNHNSGY